VPPEVQFALERVGEIEGAFEEEPVGDHLRVEFPGVPCPDLPEHLPFHLRDGVGNIRVNEIVSAQ